jgi:hypothetical protein
MITTYIIPAGNLVAVKAKLQQGAEDETKNLRGILGMFTTALSATGTGNATHYCSSGIMSAEEEEWLEANLPKSLFGYKGLHAMTVDGITTQVEWTPWDAFADKGLKMIATEFSTTT